MSIFLKKFEFMYNSGTQNIQYLYGKTMALTFLCCLLPINNISPNAFISESIIDTAHLTEMLHCDDMITVKYEYTSPVYFMCNQIMRFLAFLVSNGRRGIGGYICGI